MTLRASGEVTGLLLRAVRSSGGPYICPFPRPSASFSSGRDLKDLITSDGDWYPDLSAPSPILLIVQMRPIFVRCGILSCEIDRRGRSGETFELNAVTFEW